MLSIEAQILGIMCIASYKNFDLVFENTKKTMIWLGLGKIGPSCKKTNYSPFSNKPRNMIRANSCNSLNAFTLIQHSKSKETLNHFKLR